MKKCLCLILMKLLFTGKLVCKNIGAFKGQHTTRAAGHALTTRQAPAILDRNTKPGMPADINPYRAVEHAHTALHTASRVRHNLPLDNHLSTRGGNR